MESCKLVMKFMFRTLGGASVSLSQLCAIQAFVHATMWHNTQPKTLGISIWATSLFASACFNGIFCSFIYTLCNLMGIRKSQTDVLRLLLSLCGRIAPAVLLAVSSLPVMDKKPEGRTILLYCAVFTTQLHVMLQLLGCDRLTKEKMLARRDIRKNYRLFALSSGGVTGCDAVTAALFAMGLRWLYWGVNVLYENWLISVVLAGIVTFHSVAVVLFDRDCSWNNNIIFMLLTTLKKTKRESCKDAESARDGVNHSLQVTRDDLSSSGSSNSFLDKKRHDSTHFQSDFELNGHYTIKTASDCKDGGTLTSVGDRSRCCSKSSCMDGFFCYAIVAPAVGSIGYLFMWMFTSPTILRLWGQFSSSGCGYMVFISFAVGCCVSVMLNLENLTRVPVVSHCTNNNTDPQNWTSKRPRYIVMAVVVIFTLTGVSLLLFTNRTSFYIGAGILSLAVPVLLRLLLTMAYELLTYEIHPDLSRKLAKSWRISGFFVVSATLFGIHHVIAVTFINPQVITFFHGNLQYVLYPLVVISVLPVILNPFIYTKFNSRDRPTISSPGPLLESPLSEIYPDFNELKRSSSKTKENNAQTKNSKLCYIFLIVLFGLVICLAKLGLLIPRANCQSSLNSSSRNESKYNIRVISWNVLLGHTYTGRDNLYPIADVINEYDPDFIALQEATGHAPYWGGKDIFGFLETKSNVCRHSSKRVNPMQGTLEVGVLSKFPILGTDAVSLPNLGVKQLPTYTMSKMTTRIPSGYDNSVDDGSTLSEYTNIHIYAVHAVYKNWTCSRETAVSCAQMKVLHDHIQNIPRNEPVILMGDFNVNPSEPELDLWFSGDLGFKSALWPDRTPGRKFFNYTCGSEPEWDDDTCDCECRNKSSDPPERTLLNRNAAVDHIFYRGLNLNEATILSSTGAFSDHYPVMADFLLQS